VHGIALAADLGRGFVSNGREGTVSIFDIKTLATSSKVKVGDYPDAILYDPATSGYSRLTDAARIRRQSTAPAEKVLGTIKLGR